MLAVGVASVGLTGCIDNNYDLSDINTDVMVRVNDLVVPVNLDAITLSNVFDLNEDDEDATVREIDGEYAVLVNGSFSSDKIHVNAVSLDVIHVNPTRASVSTGFAGGEIPAGNQSVSIPIGEVTTDFRLSNDNVDKAIREFDMVKVNWNLGVELDFSSFTSPFANLVIDDLKLVLPHGLKIDGYDLIDGVISLGACDLTSGIVKRDFKVTAIDAREMASADFSFVPDTDGTRPGSLEVKGKIGIKSAIVKGTTKSTIPVPASLSLSVVPKVGLMNVTNFSGVLQYSLGDMNVESVDLSDLPDVLAQPETNISLSNPQLYFSVNNPVAAYNAVAHTGLSLTPWREGVAAQASVLPADQQVRIGYDKGETGPYLFCLSPKQPAKFHAGYEGATFRAYPSLATVLAGEGLPESLEVSFMDAGIGGPTERVVDFRLGHDLSEMSGNYTFYAPLAFNVGSTIVYSKDTDGWNDDTFDKVTVEKVNISMTIENSLPFDIEFYGWPVDVHGEQLADPSTRALIYLGDAESRGATRIPAGAKAEVRLGTYTANGSACTIRNIDGIHYEAKAVVVDGDRALRPEETITLTGIRATVSGYYIDEL